MNRREFLGTALAGAVTCVLPAKLFAGRSAMRPNIIYIMLDELGYFELSCMGSKHMITPNIDRMVDEGMRFTQCLAGGCVCAPTRSVLITGEHTGHTPIRGNGKDQSINDDNVTIAEVLKQAGYATGGFGKWGLGDVGTPGVPEKQGFDLFYGYYDQVHAHTYYPEYLIRNSKKENLPGNTGDIHEGETFSHYLIYEESVKFIRQNKDRPFFCYMAWTPPHGQWGFPKDDPSWQLYKDKKWNAGSQKGPLDAQVYAAMVNMADRQIGEVFDLLKELGIDDNTIVFFCGDNGGQHYFNTKEFPEGFFNPNGGVFRGQKRDLTEGGLRIPFVVRWPGKIKAGAISDHLCYFPDIMPTFAELAGADIPATTDGISMLPTLVGAKKAGHRQAEHEYLYWEHQGDTAVRMGDFKAIRIKDGPWELYNLKNDSYEANDIADRHPEMLKKMVAYAKESHRPPRQPDVSPKSL